MNKQQLQNIGLGTVCIFFLILFAWLIIKPVVPIEIIIDGNILELKNGSLAYLAFACLESCEYDSCRDDCRYMVQQLQNG